MLFGLDNYRRLIISQFLLGMMFFYGIEQLFINTELHDAAARGIITIAFTVGVLIFDVPTGVLADKHGRKLCLLYGCAVGLLSLAILGSSHSVYLYVIGALLYGLFISFHSGSLEALLYDWLASESKTKQYGKYQGSVWAAYLLGAGVANASSGYMANALSLRATYFISMAPVLLAAIIIYGIIEPKVSKSEASDRGSLSNAITLIRKNPRLIAFGLQFVAAEVLFLTIGEFGQLYMLSFGISTVALGIFWSIDALFAAAGRTFAHRLQSRPRSTILTFCVVIGIFATLRNNIGIGVFWLVYGLIELVQNIADTEIQHESSSAIRATVSSTISFVANIIGIPILILYTAIYKHSGIFAANETIIAFSVIVLIATLYARPSQPITTSEPVGIQPAPNRVV